MLTPHLKCGRSCKNIHNSKDTDSQMFMVVTKIENSQTPIWINKTITGENVPIATADSKESYQTASKSLPSITHLKLPRQTEAIINLF